MDHLRNSEGKYYRTAPDHSSGTYVKLFSSFIPLLVFARVSPISLISIPGFRNLGKPYKCNVLLWNYFKNVLMYLITSECMFIRTISVDQII